ncbi:MAG: beta-ketoacyl-ACP synthase II [Chloroflexota bacterium]|nr:beta-ketoacyl-ACP synthase II [Chloroflexota bacterium]MDE2908065.1 beta-ketoacyl-ACP synthase II [Chloroflexota bacterium]
MDKKRVVITGMGIVCPTGNNVTEAWANTAAGMNGIGFITRYDRQLTQNQLAGEVKEFDPGALFGRKDARRMDRVAQFALEASRQAIEDSGLTVTKDNMYEVGCIIGSGVGGINSFVESQQGIDKRGHRGIKPMAIPKILSDSCSGMVSLNYNLRGPNHCIVTACASGNNAIGEAMHIIRRGDAKAMVAGASEAAIVPLCVAGFNNMTALSRNDDPETASRPFDLKRDGFVPGEGAGVLVLEALDYALERGAKVYGELLGYGHTSDAYHITAPMETGEGAAKAVEFALRDAALSADEIDYINAHGTSTPLNDTAETNALKRALGETVYNIPVSSTKSMTGHLLGGGAAIEAIFSIMAIRENFIPPTIHLDVADPTCDLNYVPNAGCSHQVRHAMSNAFGFGGHNAVIIVGEYRKNGEFR